MTARVRAQAEPTATSSERSTAAASVAPPEVSAALAEPGASLPPELLAHAQRILRSDAASVRIHDTPLAGASARALDARAYAIRPHIVFAPGAYQPQSARGQALLLHELGHLRQQAPRDPDRPLHLGRAEPHEADADRVGFTGAPATVALPQNHLALEPNTAEPPEDRRAALTALIAERGPSPAPPVEPAPRTGTLRDGTPYTILPSGNVEVRFPPAREGRLIIHDADDPADLGVAPADPHAPAKLPTVDLKATGEQAVQRETKRLVAYDTPVTAVFKPEHLETGPDGAPVGLKTLKPIAVSATTVGEGRLVQNERNVTTTGPSRVVKDTEKEKVIQGTFSFSKGPGEQRDKQFDKLERAVTIGRTVERSTARVVDATTGNIAETTTVQEAQGLTRSTRGKAQDGTYVLDNQGVGTTSQTSERVQTYRLASGREIVVSADDGKRAHLTESKKDLDNQGLEYQALDQKERKTKRGLETAGKRTRTAVYAYVPENPNDPEGPQRRVLVGASTARTGTLTLGTTTPTVTEDVAQTRRGPVAVKRETTTTDGLSGAGSLVTDRASGLRAASLSGSLQAGRSRTTKSSSGPDVPDLAARPPTGQAELARFSKKLTPNVDASLAVSDTGVRGELAASTSRGLEKLPETKRHTELFGIFCMDSVVEGTKLAGYMAEARGSLEAQRGGRGAQLAGAQAAAGVSANLQAGWLDERTLKIKIRPDPAKIPWPWVRSVTEVIEPVLDLKFKGHTFAGLELKGEARAQASREAGRGGSVSGSAFLGLRAGADIEGSLQVGRVAGSDSGSALGTIKGGLAAILGASAAFKATATLIGGKVVAGAEGSLAFPAGLQASLRAEIDAWRLAAVGANVLRKLPDAAVYVAGEARDAARATARAASDLYRHDDLARAQIAARAHEGLALPQRVALVKSLLAGHTGDDDQRAILVVLEDAARRGDLPALVAQVGDYRLRFALDGAVNARYHQLLGR